MKINILDTINKAYNNIFKKDDILRNVITTSVLELPYYNGFYNEYLITTTKSGNSDIFFINKYIDAGIIKNNLEFDHIYFKKEHLEYNNCIINSFLLSDNAEEYYKIILKKSINDIGFRQYLKNSPDHIFKLLKINKLTDELKSYIISHEKKGMNEDLQYIKHTKIDNFYNNEEERLKVFKLENTEKLINFKSKLKDINELKHEYENNIFYFLSHFRDIKPYLFNRPKKDDLTFEFAELNATDIFNKTLNSQNIIFSENILKKNNIKKRNFLYTGDDNDDFFKYLSFQPNEISSDINNEDFGLSFISHYTCRPSEGKTCFLLAKSNEEIVGFISFNSNKENKANIFRSISSSVKYNHRGIGLTSKLYEKIFPLFDELNLTFISNLYTKDGEKYILPKKKSLSEKYKNCFFLDTDQSLFNYEKGYIVYEFSRSFSIIINKVNDTSPINFNSKKLKELYDENVEQLKNKIAKNDDTDLFDFKDDLIKSINEKLFSSREKNKTLKIK